MCVDLRGVQSSVPKHFLDIASVGSVFKHMGSHRVAKNVASAMLGDIGGTVQFSYDPLNPNKNALMEFGDRGLEILGPVPIMLVGIGLVALYIRTQRRNNRTSLSWSPCNSS